MVGKSACHASVENWVQIPRANIKPGNKTRVNDAITPVRKFGKTGEPLEAQEPVVLGTAAVSRDLA